MTISESAAPSTLAVDTQADVQTPTGRRPHFWQRFTDARRPDGQDLAALRRGTDREAGTVPAMWPYYTTLTEDGRRTPALIAEHLALTLFAVHQQSKPKLMHADGVGLGTAILRLKQAKEFSAEAVDRRFGAAATATSITELGVHLRGLVTQLRGIGQPLDYTGLARDLRDWQTPERAAAVRRRWGGQYFAPPKAADAKAQQQAHKPTADAADHRH
jgi:CRISPR system Cascade subunit CasB